MYWIRTDLEYEDMIWHPYYVADINNVEDVGRTNISRDTIWC